MSGHHDVVIVGAGPAGLSLATGLANAGFSVGVLEQQSRLSLAEPLADGREIALTRRAIAILQSLGLWQHISPEWISPIREARVLNGDSARYLGFDPRSAGLGALGYLVPNHVIRKAAYDEAAGRSSISLLDGAKIERLNVGDGRVRIRLADGRDLDSQLLIAADSRYSDTRRRLGIGAEYRDFGRSVIVCRFAHDGSADGIAYECFGYGRTLAILPLNDDQVSAVVTVASNQVEPLLRLPAAAFADCIGAQFTRLGRLRLLGERHTYPLVATYADRFATHRGVLIGDAAVGMHPVTAHGFNLGLYGIDTLMSALAIARDQRRDIGSLRVLSTYEREHRQASRPLYLATNALVSLYTDERGPARLLRAAALRIAGHLPALTDEITRRLTSPSGGSRIFRHSQEPLRDEHLSTGL